MHVHKHLPDSLPMRIQVHLVFEGVHALHQLCYTDWHCQGSRLVANCQRKLMQSTNCSCAAALFQRRSVGAELCLPHKARPCVRKKSTHKS